MGSNPIQDRHQVIVWDLITSQQLDFCEIVGRQPGTERVSDDTA